MRSEAPVPTVGQVVAVVDAQLGSGLLRCLGCGGRLARWGFGKERDLVGLGGVTGRVRPRRALCAGCGVSRVLLPDSMLRRRQYGVEVIWAGLLAAARGRPWNRVAAELGVPYTTVWKAPPFPDCGNGILLSRYLRFQELIADLLRRPVPVR